MIVGPCNSKKITHKVTVTRPINGSQIYRQYLSIGKPKSLQRSHKKLYCPAIDCVMPYGVHTTVRKHSNQQDVHRSNAQYTRAVVLRSSSY